MIQCAMFCLQSQNKLVKLSDIISGVTVAAREECDCSFVEDVIKEDEFSCRSGDSMVVFRAEINYISYDTTYEAVDFVGFISQWVETGGSLVANGSKLEIDSTCPTQLNGFEDPDCIIVDAVSPTTAQPQADNLQTTLEAVGGVASIICVGLIVLVIVLVVVIVLRSSAKKNKNNNLR